VGFECFHLLVEIECLYTIFRVERSEFPGHQMCESKNEFEDGNTSQIKGKPFDESPGSTISLLLILVKHILNSRDIDTICHNPEEQELNSEKHVLVLQLELFLTVVSELVLPSSLRHSRRSFLLFSGSSSLSWWSVAPGDIMKVAHSIDLKSVCVGWKEDHVNTKSNNVSVHVL